MYHNDLKSLQPSLILAGNYKRTLFRWSPARGPAFPANIRLGLWLQDKTNSLANYVM